MTNPHAADSAVGERLRKAREAAGYSLADVSARSKIPIRVLETLESGDWAAVGAPVFVRGHVRAYARLLGLTLDDQALPSPLTTSQIPSLVSHTHVPRYRHVAENLGRRLIYIVLTVALVVPVWLAARSSFQTAGPAVAPLDVPAPVSSVTDGPTPMVASIAPLPTAAPERSGIVLEFGGESWVQLFDAQGRLVESGLVAAGQRRDLEGAGVVRAVLGNASTVRAMRGGEAIDLAPYSQANVARFTLSSDGSLAPIAPAGP
ncbi:MAG: helix-turn-helix domain-containing protein [Pseudomonadota bacterium]